MNNQSEFIADCLWRFQPQIKFVAAALAKENLADIERNRLLLTFKKMSRLYRRMLQTAECYEAVSSTELRTAWREFVETGETVWREQFEIINAKLAKLPAPKMSMHGLSAFARSPLLDSLARVEKLRRDFEGYKCELPAIVLPQNVPSQ